MLRKAVGFKRSHSKRQLTMDDSEENVDPLESSLGVHVESDPSRPPLTAIQDPDANSVTAASETKKLVRTPSGKKQLFRSHDFNLRTPEKPALMSKNRFGWAPKVDCVSNGSENCENNSSNGTGKLPPLGRSGSVGAAACGLSREIASIGFTTPRTYKATGGVKESYHHSENSSAHSTPTKSVNRPPNTGLCLSRPYSGTGSRIANFAAASRGLPVSSVSPTVVNSPEVPHFEMREDPAFWMEHNVQVVIRVRPLNSAELSMHGYNRCLKQEGAQSISWIGQPETQFVFDHVACETTNQESLFRVVGLPMVENCMSGYNSSIFAYGQTGSGKTFTMLGDIDELEVRPRLDRGMTPRIFEFLFARIKAEEESRRDEKLKYNCRCSFLELYNEQITDLLDPSSTNLLLREDTQKGVYVENLTEFAVQSTNDIVKLLLKGAANRKVAATDMNRESSRSHSVFTCVIESTWEKDSLKNLRFARLNLVDLAGSERQKTSGAEGDRLREAANINKSLSTLGHVIMVLVDVAHGKAHHIPYRDSRLTFLLQDSLGGNSKTVIVANVSPSICCTSETLSTLRFAQRAKFIQNNAVVNEDASGDVTVLRHQIRLLKEEISILRRQNVTKSPSYQTTAYKEFEVHGYEDPVMESLPENTQEKKNNVYMSVSSDDLGVSTKQFEFLETSLVGALRREKAAETIAKQLEAEIEQLNKLVHLREEDNRCTKMMLKFREDKIQRMEALVDGLITSDSYILEERNSLAEEVQLLRNQEHRNPEVTRFALENIRLLNQLKRLQDFYEEGERELLLEEMSELKNQLVQYLDHKSRPDKNVAMQDTSISRENDILQIELKRTCQELEDCRNNLNSCLEMNKRLSRELDDITSVFNNTKNVCKNENAGPVDMDVCSEFSPPNTKYQKEVDCAISNGTEQIGEEILNLQLELDILKIILREERSYRDEAKERVFLASSKLALAEEKVFLINKNCEDTKDALAKAKSVIEALELQKILLISEMDGLRKNNIVNMDLLRDQYMEITILKEKIGTQIGTGKSESTISRCRKHQPSENLEIDSPLQMKLNRTQASHYDACKINMNYQNKCESKKLDGQETDDVHKEVEADTAEVIICLQEEVFSLQQKACDSKRNEMQAKERLLETEAELSEVRERLCFLNGDSERLIKILEEKDNQLESLADWETFAHEIGTLLSDTSKSLEDACDQVDPVADIACCRTWICEKVCRIMKTIPEKDTLIEQLQMSLEDAQSVRYDLQWKLKSLRDATLEIAEVQEGEIVDKNREILLMKVQLSEKNSLMSELEIGMKQVKDELRKAEIRATVAFLTVSRIAGYNSVYLEELKDKTFQLNKYEEMNFRKDACLQEQITLAACYEEQIQSLKIHLGKTEKNAADLQAKLDQKHEQVLSMEYQLEKLKNDFSAIKNTNNLRKAEIKLNEFKLEVCVIQTLINECSEQENNSSKTDNDLGKDGVEGGNDDIEVQISTESTHSINEVCSRDIYDTVKDNMERSVNEKDIISNMCKMELHSAEGAYNMETTIFLLRTELESALDSLNGVRAQMCELLKDRKENKQDKIQNRKMIEHVICQIKRMDLELRNKEEIIEGKLLILDHKIRIAEEKANDSVKIYNEVKKDLLLKENDAREFALEKDIEVYILLSQFQEAKKTIEDANMMVSSFVALHNAEKLQNRRHIQTQELLISEKDNLTGEVSTLQSSLATVRQELHFLQQKLLSNISELECLVISVQNEFGQVQAAFMEGSKLLSWLLDNLKSQFLCFTGVNGKLLEDVYLEITRKDSAVSALHLCQLESLLEKLIVYVDNKFLACGLYDTNKSVSGLRQQNFEGEKELDMSKELTEKLAANIDNSFLVAMKEEEHTNVRSKTTLIDQSISESNLLEESLLGKSNALSNKLVVLMKKMDDIDKNIMAEMFSKDVMVLVLSSELKQYMAEVKHKELQIVDFEIQVIAFDSFIEKFCLETILSMVQGELAKQMSVELEVETCFFREQVSEANIQLHILSHDFHNLLVQLTHLRDENSELEKKIRNLEQECHERTFKERCMKEQIVEQQSALDEKNKDLRTLLERLNVITSENKSLTVDIQQAKDREEEFSLQIQHLENENAEVLETLCMKEAALESSLSVNAAFVQQQKKFHDDVSSLKTTLSKLQEELFMKKTEVHELQCYNSNIAKDANLKHDEFLNLRVKSINLLNENERLTNEVTYLNLEYSKVMKELQENQLKMDSYSNHAKDLELENCKLQDISCSLRASLSNIEAELYAKQKELATAASSISSLSIDLALGNEKCERLLYLEQENELLKKDLLSVSQKKDNVLALYNVKHEELADSIQSKTVILNRISQIISGEHFNKIDDALQEIYKINVITSHVIMELEFLESCSDKLLSENISLRSELLKKDEAVIGLLSDLHMLQESSITANYQQDVLEEMVTNSQCLKSELASKSCEVDKLISHCQLFEAQLLEKCENISRLEAQLAKEQCSLELITCENITMKSHIENFNAIKVSMELELEEKDNLIIGLKSELFEMTTLLDQQKHQVRSLDNEMAKLMEDRDQLNSKVFFSREQLEMAEATAEEYKVISTENQKLLEMVESRKAYVEEKEQEVKLLEISIVELECTVDVLQNKLEIVKDEAERQRLQREELEIERQVVKQQLLETKTCSIKNVTDGENKIFPGHYNADSCELKEVLNEIQILQRNLADKEAEIDQYQVHILELNLHAEAQARQNAHKIEELEILVSQLKVEPSSLNILNSAATRFEKPISKTRGSNSPFKCIGLGLTHQINLEKEEELAVGRLRTQELESLVAKQQKEIFSLNSKLAASESMTHDVIRDLLGVKLDMASYASLLDHQPVQKTMKPPCLQSTELQKEENDTIHLKKRLNQFIEERQGWIDELDRRQSEMIATKIALEKLRQHEHFLSTENEILKADNTRNKKMVMQLENEVEELSSQHNLQSRIHHHAKIKEENNILKLQKQDLAAKLQRSEEILLRLREELASHRSSCGQNPYPDIDEEQKLRGLLEISIKQKMQVDQNLLSLLTCILKVAGIKEPPSEITPSQAEDVLHQLEDEVHSLKSELQHLKFKDVISSEKLRLLELAQHSSPAHSKREEFFR